MKRPLLCLLLVTAAAPAQARTDAWVLTQSDLTYSAFHPLHDSFGTTRATRGKGVCDETGCRFLIAVPVNTFDSGDANRDTHMIETVRGAQYPLIQVNAVLPAEPAGPDFELDADITFAGQKVHYGRIPFHVVEQKGDVLHITGTIPLTMSDFKITPPSLLTMKIKNEIPVKADMVWQRQPSAP